MNYSRLHPQSSVSRGHPSRPNHVDRSPSVSPPSSIDLNTSDRVRHSVSKAPRSAVNVDYVGQNTDPRAQEWKISWQSPLLMTLCLILGTGCAIAHHVYYQSLDQQAVDDFSQEWAVRIGTGLAFLTRAFLVASAAMAFQQYTWLLWRSRAMSLSAIDDLMGVLGDLFPFLNFDLWKSAFAGVLVAIVIWYVNSPGLSTRPGC